MLGQKLLCFVRKLSAESDRKHVETGDRQNWPVAGNMLRDRDDPAVYKSLNAKECASSQLRQHIS